MHTLKTRRYLTKQRRGMSTAEYWECVHCGRVYDCGACMSDDCPGFKGHKRGMVTKERHGVEISEAYEVRALEDGRAELYYWCCAGREWIHAFTLLNKDSAVSVGEDMIRIRLEQR